MIARCSRCGLLHVDADFCGACPGLTPLKPLTISLVNAALAKQVAIGDTLRIVHGDKVTKAKVVALSSNLITLEIL